MKKEASRIWNVLKTPLVITLILAMIANFAGLYGLMDQAGVAGVYDAVASMATTPIVAMILFVIGYRFELKIEDIGPLLKTALLRMIVLGLGGLALSVIFKDLVADQAFRIAIRLYFFCPPALVLPSILEPVMRDENDKAFVSAFLSFYMIITLIAYVCIVVLMA